MVAGRSRCTVLRVRRPAWKPFQPLTASGKTPGRFPMLRLIAGFLAGCSISLCFAQDDAVVITAARFPQPPADDLVDGPRQRVGGLDSNKGNGFKLINVGLSHMSNGIDPNSHRGWSREYVQGGWEWDRLSVLARAWRVLPESDDDNPDIRSFMGSGDLVARYQTAGGYVASVLLRRNLGTGRGFTQVDWATPALKVFGGLRLHAQATSGYGETLIDYNFQQTTFGIGVSFGD